jgi:hypothetical protein
MIPINCSLFTVPGVARECGVGSGTVQRIRQEMKGPFVGVAA